MKFTLSWLRDHLDTDATVDEIAATLTRIGLEVEGVHNPAQSLAPFVIARVISAVQHPNADKLRLCMVDAGGPEPVQVVCGAPNAREGMMAVFAPPGAYVPGTGITLRVAPVRGIESRGMLVSERELELSDAHEGIIDLPEDAGPVGHPYAAWAGLDDPVIEVAITPNRQDCMGVAGIARDLAAAGLGTLRHAPVRPVPGTFPCPVAIATKDPEGCPAFMGRVIRGVVNGPSPDWMQRRLRAIGLRPISALVDITNYLSFGWGRPLHVYDVAKLNGGLTARRARAGETVHALNGKTYALDETMTVIADDAHVHDIGGIMGGMESGVSETTTQVLIECAYFTPSAIGATGRKLGIFSDARARFERGVDPAFLGVGLELATAMVLDLCGGEVSETVLAGAIPDWRRSVSYRPARCLELAGIAVPADEQALILTHLGFGVEAGDTWEIAVPSWRRDIDGPADIVEEVARIAGFDRIPATPLGRPVGVAPPTASPAQLAERRARRAAAAEGLMEAVTWSFLAPDEAAPFGEAHWTLDNPISADLAVMRPSLVAGLLAAASRNFDRGSTSVRLFEIGRRYLADREHPTLGLLIAGESRARDWQSGPAVPVTAHEAKALVEAILAAAGAPVERLQVMGDTPDWLHPGRSARLALNPKQPLAVVGELHPRLARALGRPVAVAEIYLDALPPARTKRARPPFTPPALQPVTRDFAFLAPETLAADALVRAVRGADKAAITHARLFDRFTGAGVPAGEVSLAVEVALQPTDKSFTEADLDAIAQKIVAAAAKLGARLRG